MNELYEYEKEILNDDITFTVWENNQINPKYVLHPNYWGYQYIAEKIVRFIQ
jgi:hypothetical protein